MTVIEGGYRHSTCQHAIARRITALQPEIASQTTCSTSSCSPVTDSKLILNNRDTGNEISGQKTAEQTWTVTLALRNALQPCNSEDGSEDLDVFHVDCSLVSSNLPLGSCTCTSMSRTAMVGDQSLYPWISEMLHSFRQRHLIDRTGEWLFASDTFRRWLLENATSFLWLHGSAGAGKSMLTSAVIQNLQTQRGHDNIVAYYFGDGRFKNSNVVVNILWVMLSELFSQMPEGESRNRVQILLATLNSNESQISITMLNCFFSEIKHSLKDGQTLFLVLDGLDEIEELPSRDDSILRELLRLMHSYDPKHPVKCFMSSRPDYLRHFPLRDSFQVDMDNEISAQTDLVSFFDQGVGNLQPLNDNQDLRGMTRQLLSEGKPTFLWASLVLRTLSTDHRSPTTDDNPLKVRSNMGLFGLYDYLLGKISEKDRPVVLKIFRWVIEAARPLQLRELRLIFPDIEFTNSDISRISGGLLVTSKSGMICLVHLSVKGYLQSISDGWTTTPDDPNEMIAHSCMVALASVHLLHTLGIPTNPTSKTSSLSFPLPTILLYAFHYWKFHFVAAERHSRYLSGLLHSCLLKSFEHVENGDLQSPKISLGSVSTHVTVSNLALRASACFGFESPARLELQMGATAHFNNLGHENTALHQAAMAGHLGVAKLLLQYGANRGALSCLGHTPLFSAVAFGHCDMVRLLLDYEPGSSAITSGEATSKLCDAQDLTLTAILSESCTECDELQACYVLSRDCPNQEDEHLWPSIEIMGESISHARIGGLPRRQDSKQAGEFYSDLVAMEEKISIRWFPGPDMYKALGLAAKRGISEVKNLFLAAGNDAEAVESITSVNRLASRMTATR